jgi:hypothetical protein
MAAAGSAGSGCRASHSLATAAAAAPGSECSASAGQCRLLLRVQALDAEPVTA